MDQASLPSPTHLTSTLLTPQQATPSLTFTPLCCGCAAVPLFPPLSFHLFLLLLMLSLVATAARMISSGNNKQAAGCSYNNNNNNSKNNNDVWAKIDKNVSAAATRTLTSTVAVAVSALWFVD